MPPAKPKHLLKRHKNIVDRVRSKALITPTGCWHWTGAITSAGYGSILYKGKTWQAHRLSYELFHGPILDGLPLDHLCRNRACINPAHLDPVTLHQNALRRVDIRPTHCPAGHEYTPSNTIWAESRVPGYKARKCRTCHHRFQREARARKAAARRLAS